MVDASVEFRPFGTRVAGHTQPSLELRWETSVSKDASIKEWVWHTLSKMTDFRHFFQGDQPGWLLLEFWKGAPGDILQELQPLFPGLRVHDTLFVDRTAPLAMLTERAYSVSGRSCIPAHTLVRVLGGARPYARDGSVREPITIVVVDDGRSKTGVAFEVKESALYRE